jgi:5'-nucleotidase / UDP-sugar diphosphatase
MIKELDDGTMIGICGLTVKVTTEQSSFPDEGTTIDDEATAGQACVDELQGQGITHIVMLTHMGYSNDLEWLSAIDGVDVVIGGHSHSLLGGDDFAQFGFVPLGDYASLENGKCIVTAWEYMRVVGSLTVEFDDDGNVVSCSGSAKAALNPDQYTVRDADPLFDMDAADAAIMTEWITSSEQFPNSPFVAIAPDATIEAILQPFFDSSDDKRMEVIGTAPETICHTYTSENPLCEGAVTNFMSGGVCNLVAQGFLFNAPTADFAIQNRGGCRTDILAGDISFGSVFDILPFANTLVLLTMTGPQIKSLLEDALNFFLDEVCILPEGILCMLFSLLWLTQ